MWALFAIVLFIYWLFKNQVDIALIGSCLFAIADAIQNRASE